MLCAPNRFGRRQSRRGMVTTTDAPLAEADEPMDELAFPDWE